MTGYKSMSADALRKELDLLQKRYKEYQAMNLALNISRGRPAKEQLNLSLGLLHSMTESDLTMLNGMDARNYGGLEGTPSARKLFGELLGLAPEEVIVCGSSSLNIMFDLISHAYTHGVLGGSKPWSACEHPKFLCPVPGYDRHFGITEYFNIEMIPVPMNEEGPDMDVVRQYAEHDPEVKGIWCVPKYSNPAGITYSDRVVREFAALRPAADDFRIFWDNAYAIHDLYEDHQDTLLNLMDECKKNGTENMMYEFFSTSKITFAGSGVAVLGASSANIRFIAKQFSVQTIGWNKINMMAHVEFFQNAENVMKHMKLHAAIIRPKFETVISILEKEVSDIASWKNPNGGYFISFDSEEGCAKRIYELCSQAGLVLTEAGATYPYHIDPKDSNIRIAPTSVGIEELKKAVTLFCHCVRLATVEKLLADQA